MDIEHRKGMPDPQLDEAEFRRRFMGHYVDPAFNNVQAELDRVAAVAWDGYIKGRKAPITQKAGAGYADPTYDLSIDWIRARAAIDKAQAEHHDGATSHRILLINCSSRSEHTCPGEMSKSYRLVKIAEEIFTAQAGVNVEILDLSRLASEYGREIHPCKACFSTAPALCHWPCSCYPNHAMGQVNDWMNEIYPMWVRAHGIMIVTPVNWYQGSSPLKLMMDRLVCADGGNADPTLTHGKDAKKAKEIELAGWDYPRHLASLLHTATRGSTAFCAQRRSASPAGLISWRHITPNMSSRYVPTPRRKSTSKSVATPPTPPARVFAVPRRKRA